MKGWKQSANGTWSLTAHGRSISLPPDFELDSEAEGTIGFTGVTADREMSWIIYERTPLQEIINTKLSSPDHKVLSNRTVEDLNVIEIAPTTPSGRAQAKVRIHIIELADDTSLVVVGGGTAFVYSLARQWAA